MNAPGPHDPGALVHFRHRDATSQAKGKRPGVVDKLRSGNLTLFYGSTFKRRGPPQDAIEANPRGEPGTDARTLADYLDGFVDEPTYFHGSLVSETPLLDDDVAFFAKARFPNDLLDDLREQAEDRMLAFLQAWDRLRWLQPASRARLLDALWWKLDTDAATEALLTLALCDGWSITEITGLGWADLRGPGGVVRLGDDHRRLLPRTPSLLEGLPRQGDLVFAPLTREQVLDRMRTGWATLTRAALPPGRRSSPFPKWEQVLERIDR